MDLSDLITPDAILPALKANSKKQAIQAVAEKAALFTGLARPIDFEALDEQPVDLVFLLLAPESAGADHLKALARIARHLREPDVARKLRDSRDAEAIYAVL